MGLAREIWTKAGKDNLGLIASGVAFYGFLAVVPLLTALVISYGLIAEPSQVATHIAALTRIMPEQAAEIIGSQLKDMVARASPGVSLGLFLSLIIAIYGAMRGAGAFIIALNIVYGVEDKRSFIRRTAVAVAITVSLVGIFVLASLTLSAIGLLQKAAPMLNGAVFAAIQIIFLLVAAWSVRFAISTIYRFSPNRPPCPDSWLKPGSAVATIGWLVTTTGFAFYVKNFGNYNATYGALGAVIIFLTWLYLSAYVILLGAELNSILERRRNEKTRSPGSGPDGRGLSNQ